MPVNKPKAKKAKPASKSQERRLKLQEQPKAKEATKPEKLPKELEEPLPPVPNEQPPEAKNPNKPLPEKKAGPVTTSKNFLGKTHRPNARAIKRAEKRAALMESERINREGK